jgi:hypothetical protein
MFTTVTPKLEPRYVQLLTAGGKGVCLVHIALYDMLFYESNAARTTDFYYEVAQRRSP